MSGVFDQLIQGSSVTAGLRKVGWSEMTHQNPTLRAGSTVPERSNSQTSISSNSQGKSLNPFGYPEKMDRDSIMVFEDRLMPRSVYFSGFGEEDSKTQLDVEAFFAVYGPYNAIRFQIANGKLFKGSRLLSQLRRNSEEVSRSRP